MQYKENSPQQLALIQEARENILAAEDALLNVAGLIHCVDTLHSLYFELKDVVLEELGKDSEDEAESTNEQVRSWIDALTD